MSASPRSAILWQNRDHTVTLLDIPRSIEAAQGTARYPCFDHILSSEALQVAFPSDQPKTEAAKAKLTNNTVDQVLHEGYEAILRQALEDVKCQYDGQWCLQRPFVAHGTKRKRSSPEASVDDEQSESKHAIDLPQAVLDSAVRGSGSTITRVGADDSTGEPPECACVDDVAQHNFLTNCAEEPTTCQMKHKPRDYHFRLPPGASAFLGDCAQSRDFHRAVRSQASAHDTRRHFDFVLMDPPWPNRSVRRTHKTAGSTYQISLTMDTMYNLIVGMDLDMLMTDNGLVGIWITSNQAVRDLVLGEGGLFEQWGMVLEEEWLWLKITAKGEPMMSFDNVWRKPYEVLLIGRRHRGGREHLRPPDAGVKRRVLAAVPDLHSRKPCLREMMERLLPDDHRALEIFARHLVAGWWSWGNECIKFNWDGYWRS